MKYAADFRCIARNALSGRWGVAVITGVVASLLGAIASDGPEIKFNVGDNGIYSGLNIAGQEIYTNEMGWNLPFARFLVGGMVFIFVVAIVMAVAYFILGSIIQIGYARFNLDLVDRGVPGFETLFGYFSNWKTTAIARLLQSVYILLWSLLFIIPGVIATYSYAMTEFILAENPDLTASEAIARSKEMMSGNRWRLFCLHFSFIGWDILSSLTLGIGNLWLRPYKQAANAAFYREITGFGTTSFEYAEENY